MFGIGINHWADGPVVLFQDDGGVFGLGLGTHGADKHAHQNFVLAVDDFLVSGESTMMQFLTIIAGKTMVGVASHGDEIATVLLGEIIAMGGGWWFVSTFWGDGTHRGETGDGVRGGQERDGVFLCDGAFQPSHTQFYDGQTILKRGVGGGGRLWGWDGDRDRDRRGPERQGESMALVE